MRPYIHEFQPQYGRQYGKTSLRCLHLKYGNKYKIPQMPNIISLEGLPYRWVRLIKSMMNARIVIKTHKNTSRGWGYSYYEI